MQGSVIIVRSLVDDIDNLHGCIVRSFCKAEDLGNCLKVAGLHRDVQRSPSVVLFL